MAIGAAMSLFHVWTTAMGPPEAMIFRGTHLVFALVLIFLICPLKSRGGEGTEAGRPMAGPLDLLAGALALAAVGYIFATYDSIVYRMPYVDDLTKRDLVFGVLTILVVIEGTRRIIGPALPITALVFLAYALFIARADPATIVDQLVFTTEGIYGTTLGVSASYVIVFVLFGSFMERTGTGQLFMDFAVALTGRQPGGPGKVSVVSSSLFGTISGSAVANVMVDGPITIPLMKRSRFRPAFAGAVEAVASTGGQIMPPVMGAAAFVMAEFLAVSYFQVTLWALIPAVLYYLAVFFAVHFEAKRTGLLGVPKSEIPSLGQVMRSRGHLFIPILIILLGMIAGYSAPLCALAGAIACVPVAMLRAETRAPLRVSLVWEALEDCARNALPVAAACACAGIVIGTITLTGIGITFTAFVVALSQNSLVLALLLTMVAGIILGMGMPTTPAYIIMVSLLVPAVIKLGVWEPAAHLFAFYFAILSAITPPVALAVYAAAGLAKSDLWETGWA
ncbi:MAG: TRAP transporter fused permease subunit, partial [Alphaproteobacteria bacterium]|nr:TRAP transporter fused permease subunit [Alphaproteobacteria bacterium]